MSTAALAAPSVLPSHLPYLAFDSGAFARPIDALQSWRDNLARSWDIGLPDKADEDRFHARVQMWKMDRLLIGGGEFGPVQTRARRDRNIRADQLDHYRLLLVRQGHFDCDANGRQVRLAPGRFVITDMSLPETSLSTCSSVVLYLPREQLEQALPRPLNLHGMSPEGAGARLLAEHLQLLQRNVAQAQPEALPGLAQATLSLVAASVAMHAANDEAARPAGEAALLRQARRFVDAQLADEDLAAPQLCTHLRISRSTLYRVFEPLGGVSEFIRERRLAVVHEILSRGGERPQIARLAEAHGFKSATHFSKAFREQYGYSPRETVRYQPIGERSAPGERLESWLGAMMH